MQQHLYTVFTADQPYDPVFVLGPSGCAADVRGIVARLTAGALIREELESAGFHVMEPEPVVFDPVAPDWAGRLVRFPDDAPHVYAGRDLRVDVAPDGLPALIDPDTQIMLMADDRPWRSAPGRSMTGGLLVTPAVPFEQVPLGPILVPEQQFATADQAESFRRALRAAGYVVGSQQEASCE